MKKILCFIAATVLVSLVGCEDKSQDKSQKAETSLPSRPGKITVTAGTKTTDVSKEDKFRTFDVRGESIIKYAPEGAEITPEVKNVQVNVAVRNTPYGHIQARLLSQRLSKEFIVACSACHDDYANGVIGPSLIDKNEKEVLDMMVKYNQDPNANVLMITLVERMTDKEKAFIAKDIARFNYEYHHSASDPKKSDDQFKSNYVRE